MRSQGRSGLAIVCLAALLGAGLGPRPARARKSPARVFQRPRHETRQQARVRRLARQHFRRGRRLYHREKFQRAVESFKKAFELLPNKNILLNISICYAEMESPLRAITYLRRAERMAGDRAEKVLDPQEYQKLLILKQRVVVLQVETPDPDAEIWFNKVRIGTGRVEQVLFPGNHRVTVKVNGGIVAKRYFEIAPGQEKRWVVPDWRKGPRREAVTPPAGSQRAGRSWRRLPVAYFAAFAALAVAAGAAIIGTGLKTEDLASEYHQTGAPDLERQGQRYKAATNALIGVGAGAAAVAVVLAIFTDWKSTRRREHGGAARVLPILHDRGAGLAVTGRF